MSGPLGICVVGPGFWAQEMHIPALNEIDGATIVGLVGRDPGRTRQVAERFGIPKVYPDVDAALADDDVEILDIVAPNHVHATAVSAAAGAGKHAICIKPLGRTLQEASSMVQAADLAGTRLLYAENVPFIPAVQKSRRLVDDGSIGRVFRVKACEGIPGPHTSWAFDQERSGGGALIDMAVHSIEFCRTFVEAPVETVFAEGGTFTWGHRTAAEDTVVLTLRFADGSIGQCEDSWSLAGAMDSRFEVFGTRGRVLIDNLHRQPVQLMIADERGGAWSYPLPIPGMVADGHLAMLTHFVDCLRTGAPSRFDGQRGWEALAVVEAATRSMASGRREPVAPWPPTTSSAASKETA
jgi:predicted dehydrogenase